MKIIGISDIHGYLPDLEPCDVVCICGDIIPLELQQDTFKSWEWFNHVFIDWCEKLVCEKVIFIAGNHDFFLEGEEPFDVKDKIVYLCDSKYEYKNITFYGSPWITGLPFWAFNLSEKDQYEKFSLIPNVDVLLTHTPPYNIQDIGRVDFKQGVPIDFGSNSLTKIFNEKNIKYALSGHIHSGNHSEIKHNNTILYNCSLKDESYEVYYKPVVINI